MEDLLADFLADMKQELQRAVRTFGPIASEHEGYAVLLEELEEYWQQVKRRPAERDQGAMYRELVQVAAMAARVAIERHMARGRKD